MNDAILVLEDGRVFHGQRFGCRDEASGEVVFNTAMMGYQEILGDPSYAKQMVVMTYPMIGNYGIALEDFESRKPVISSLIVRERSHITSNWRHQQSLDGYLQSEGIVGISEIDTRALTRHLRDKGTMRGMIADASEEVTSVLARIRAIEPMQGANLAHYVSTKSIYSWTEASWGVSPVRPKRHKVVVYDFGAKRNILRRLVDVGCDVVVVPDTTSAEDVMEMQPHGVMLSNGPGDPEAVTYGIDNIRQLIGRVPLFGICLGHQMLCLAIGAKSYKLPFGHRGANHPVMDLTTGKVEITSQNHGFAIHRHSIPENIAEVTHIHLNDQTVAGVCFKHQPAFSVQYHPEAAPGPRDASYLFERFVHLMDGQTVR